MSEKKNRPLYKRVGIDIGGFGLIVLGILTGWLPGPGGIPLILAGLALLALNYTWAENLLNDLKKRLKKIINKAKKSKNDQSSKKT